MTYYGIDVLVLDYNRAGPIEERLDRGFVLLDAETGKRVADEHTESPAAVRPFTWSAFGRDEIATLREFLTARKGRAVPFWLPSFQWDLTMTEDVLTSQSVVTIEWIRYTQQYFGTTGARRHVALWTLGDASTIDCYRIAGATDPGNYETETLTIDPVAVRDYPAETTVVSFLKLCRLEEDRISISYPDGSHAEMSPLVRELPLEAPTEAPA